MRDDEKKRIGDLAREGRQISQIAEEYPEYDYSDVYWAAYGEGERSALGVKRMITNRLNSLVDEKSSRKRQEIVDETNELVWHLYEKLKSSQTKLESIRNALEA
ncbi:hypothetical protein [Chromobacterium vaccinii]|uniref:hypothetical protein n=1 Tax=Chromobacterium vaccinii TaxID=1108595 RepID=UPI00061813A1|nr:hypothetical protein [Chromobacterium vaccinii]